MEEVLQGDIFDYVISKYLDRSNKISLYLGGCISQKEIYPEIINTVKNKLKGIFGIDYDKILSFIKENDMIISGSFILESILDVNYHGDIDIYGIISNYNSCYNFINKNTFKIYDRENDYRNVFPKKDTFKVISCLLYTSPSPRD